MSTDAMTPDDARRFVRTTADDSPDVGGWYVALDADAWVIELARALANLDETDHSNLDHARWAAWLGWPASSNHARAYRALLLRPDAARYALLAVARKLLGGTSVVDARSSKEFYKWTAWRDADAQDQPHPGRPTTKLDAPGPAGAKCEAARMALGMSLMEWAARLGVATMTYRKYVREERTLETAPLALLSGWAASAYDHVARARAEARKAAAQVPPADAAEVERAALVVAAELTRRRDTYAQTAPIPEPPVIPTSPAPSNVGEQVVDMAPGPDAVEED